MFIENILIGISPHNHRYLLYLSIPDNNDMIIGEIKSTVIQYGMTANDINTVIKTIHCYFYLMVELITFGTLLFSSD